MTVSRVHAELVKIKGEWTIADRDSFNGVWVNGKAVKNAVLHQGDLLQIGCFVLRFSE
jgi:pSer/pThr/pTyr-binding forkhead associated (FHA) protein